LSTARFIMRKSMANPVFSATARSQRAVFHENGHTGSNHNVTLGSVRSL
jgi:hypothetical protein